MLLNCSNPLPALQRGLDGPTREKDHTALSTVQANQKRQPLPQSIFL